jgi:hypothetical protein
MIEDIILMLINSELTLNLTKKSNTIFFLFNEKDICLKSDLGLSYNEINQLIDWCRKNNIPGYLREGRKIISKTNDY